jgi:hypothetical protein
MRIIAETQAEIEELHTALALELKLMDESERQASPLSKLNQQIEGALARNRQYYVVHKTDENGDMWVTAFMYNAPTYPASENMTMALVYTHPSIALSVLWLWEGEHKYERRKSMKQIIDAEGHAYGFYRISSGMLKKTLNILRGGYTFEEKA